MRQSPRKEASLSREFLKLIHLSDHRRRSDHLSQGLGVVIRTDKEQRS